MESGQAADAPRVTAVLHTGGLHHASEKAVVERVLRARRGGRHHYLAGSSIP